MTLEEQPPMVQEAVRKLQKYIPDFDGVPLTPDESVKLMLDVIVKTGPANSGAYLSPYGNKKWL